MHTNFSNPQKAGIFTVVVLVLAVAAALVIDGFGLGANLFVWASVWSITPVLATLIMMLVVTRDGYSKEGWRTLGLHRLGLRVWWIAFYGLAITVVAYAVVWLTPLASVTVPPQGVLPVVGSFLLQVPILATTFLLCEEIGFRGYLLPKLLPLGRKRALLLSGLVFATWHMPLALLTPAASHRQPGHRLAPVLRRRRRGQLLLRLPAARLWKHLACLDRPRHTQQCLGNDHDIHGHLDATAGQRLPRRRVRHLDHRRRGNRRSAGQPPGSPRQRRPR